MVENDQKFTLLKGGKGGFGNNHFKSSTNRAPRKFTEGEDGTETWIWLSLKLIADVGIIGLPNAGKSTLLSKISSALPKIADYPFTTLNPVLGVVKDYDYNFVVADIPGLIEGAHKGKGLGYKFLAHIERCKILLHLVDANDKNAIKNYDAIRKELEKYGASLSEKKEVIVLSKIDLSDKDIYLFKKKFEKILDKKVLIISSNANIGLKELIKEIRTELKIY